MGDENKKPEKYAVLTINLNSFFQLAVFFLVKLKVEIFVVDFLLIKV